jgi:hypothetical protein
MYAVVLLLMTVYVGGSVLQIQRHTVSMGGLLPDRVASWLYKAKGFELGTFIVFSTVFAVSPEDHTTLVIHTAPWMLLQIGLVSLAFSNMAFGRM